MASAGSAAPNSHNKNNNQHHYQPLEQLTLYDPIGVEPKPRAKTPAGPFFSTKNYNYIGGGKIISLPVRPEGLDKHGHDRFRNILKKIVMELDKDNDRHIIIYRREPDWWQIGGCSALFYKYYLENTFNLPSITLMRDNDFGCRWRGDQDTAMIRNIARFAENIKKAHGQLILKTPELVIFELPRKFTEHEIKSFQNIREAKEARINNLLTPKNSHPHTGQAIDKIAVFVVNRISKMDAVRREIYGLRGAELINNISYRFCAMSNGRLSEAAYYEEAISRLNDFMEWLSFTRKFEIFNIEELCRLASDCTNLKERFISELTQARKKSQN